MSAPQSRRVWPANHSHATIDHAQFESGRTDLVNGESVPRVCRRQGLAGGFVYLRDVDPSIIQDIRYAGINNFMGRPIEGYGAAECVVKHAVGVALQKVQRELAAQNCR